MPTPRFQLRAASLACASNTTGAFSCPFRRGSLGMPRLLGAVLGAGLVAGLVAGEPTEASAAQPARLAVAWDDLSLGGRLAALRRDPPFEIISPILTLGADARVRTAPGRVFHLSRETGDLTVLDAESWTPTATIALGSGLAPRDVAGVSDNRAYVSCAGSSFLQRVDLASGTVTPTVDLTALALGSGELAMESMLLHEGRLFIQLGGPGGFPPEPQYLAVVDVETEQLVDADAARPGIQAILLEGTAPRFAMQVIPGTRTLLVSATGHLNPDGGLERIDLDSLQSIDIPSREFEDGNGNDIGPFVMRDAERGWLVFATDIVLSSHLHPFTLSGGTEILEAGTSLFYFAPSLVLDPTGERLFWPEPAGVRAFDAETGAALGAGPTLLSGAPTDLAIVPATVAAVPVGSGVGIGVLIGVGGWGFVRGRRQRGAR